MPIKYLKCNTCGKPINLSTHSYSDLGGYECYQPMTEAEKVAQLAGELREAVKRALKQMEHERKGDCNSTCYEDCPKCILLAALKRKGE